MKKYRVIQIYVQILKIFNIIVIVMNIKIKVLIIFLVVLTSCQTVSRPQNPEPPFNYENQFVTIYNEDDDVFLEGILSIPNNRNSFPVVVLVSGSGPHNYDAEWNYHKPFAVIADFLAENGTAVLRLNDREYNSDPELFYQNTTADFARDLSAALSFLRSYKETRNCNIGFIGHSEGGIVSAMAAAEDPDISFVILLGTPALPLRDVSLNAAVLSYEIAGTPDDEKEMLMSFHREYNELVDNYSNRNESRFKVEKLYDSYFKDTEIYNLADRYNLSTKITLPWYRYIFLNNPSDYIEKLKMPVLAVIGQYDIQVPPEENLKYTKLALSRNWNDKNSIIEFPNLNHMLQPTKGYQDYSDIDDTVSVELLHEINRWISSLGL